MFISSVPTIWWQGFASIYEVRFSCLTADTLKVGCNSSGISSLSAIEWPGWLKCSKKALKHTYQLRAMAMPSWLATRGAKQLSMAATAWVIWLCACVGYRPFLPKTLLSLIWRFFALIKVGRDCCRGVCVEWIVCCLSMFFKAFTKCEFSFAYILFLHLLHWIIYVRFVESDK